MKILYVTTIGGTMPFFKSIIKKLTDEGNIVDLACNTGLYPVPEYYREWGCKIYDLCCTRSPLNVVRNAKAIRQIRDIAKNGGYEIVHCHTPIAAFCTRLACRKLRKDGVKVIYTAHGFHFCKGAPIKNWLLFYPMEKISSKWTDTLITITTEDYDLAFEKFKAKETKYIRGVGIDTHKFESGFEPRIKGIRAELGLTEEDYLILSIGELNENKNHSSVIRAIAEMNKPEVHYLIAGKGELGDTLTSLAKELGIEKQVHLLGYRTDVGYLYKECDLLVHPSYREGLSVTIQEAMAAGILTICGDIRGNRDLISEKGLFDPRSIEEIKKKIEIMKAMSTEDRSSVLARNSERIRKFDQQAVDNEMKSVYGL